MPKYKIEDLKSSEKLLNQIEKGDEINLEKESTLNDEKLIEKRIDEAKNLSKNIDNDLNLEKFHDLDKN